MGIDINCLGPAARTQVFKKLAEQDARKEEHRLARLKAVSPHGLNFDSAGEREFYFGQVYPFLQSGEITACELHKTSLLLEASEYCGIKLHKAEFTPDFVLTHAGGEIEVVEIKSKAIRRLQGSYVYRRRLFIDKFARPQGWTFREIITE